MLSQYHKLMLPGWPFMGEGEEGVKDDPQISRLDDWMNKGANGLHWEFKSMKEFERKDELCFGCIKLEVSTGY